MRTGRNEADYVPQDLNSLDHWDMRTGRNSVDGQGNITGV